MRWHLGHCWSLTHSAIKHTWVTIMWYVHTMMVKFTLICNVLLLSILGCLLWVCSREIVASCITVFFYTEVPRYLSIYIGQNFACIPGHWYFVLLLYAPPKSLVAQKDARFFNLFSVIQYISWYIQCTHELSVYHTQFTLCIKLTRRGVCSKLVIHSLK